MDMAWKVCPYQSLLYTGICFVTPHNLTKLCPNGCTSCSRSLLFKTRSCPFCPRSRAGAVLFCKKSLVACASRDNVEKFREKLERSLGEEKKNYRDTLDGIQLRALLLQRYGLSYDIRLKVTPWFSGKYLLTANIMWLYAEQQSFPLSEHEYLCHLEAIAQYLNQWGVVNQFINFLNTTKQKPRVAKAVSVPLDVSQKEILEFMRCNK
jgi:hypothetical protein